MRSFRIKFGPSPDSTLDEIDGKGSSKLRGRTVEQRLGLEDSDVEESDFDTAFVRILKRTKSPLDILDILKNTQVPKVKKPKASKRGRRVLEELSGDVEGSDFDTDFVRMLKNTISPMDMLKNTKTPKVKKPKASKRGRRVLEELTSDVEGSDFDTDFVRMLKRTKSPLDLLTKTPKVKKPKASKRGRRVLEELFLTP